MNGVRNLLHNMKIKISKTLLFNSSIHYSAWSSDLHVGIAKHGSFPHVRLAAGGTGLTWRVTYPSPMFHGWPSGYCAKKHLV